MRIAPSLALVAENERELSNLLEVFTQANTRYLKDHPEVPHPYESGVYYQRETKGLEHWLGVEALLARGFGDCEDLAAYLAAWLRARRGVAARVGLVEYRKGSRRWYHAIVRLPDGSVLDPSAELGM